jgi:beta-N-acetylhexosaminidase
MISAAILGCLGTTLSEDEKAFFRDVRPYGFILFARNCESPDQIRKLIEELYSTTERFRMPILIDQEGGRVARLRPPHWPEFPAARRLAEAKGDSRRAVYLNARLIANELTALGITVNCAPLADIPAPGAHDIIGDRAFGEDAQSVILHARAQANGLMDGGIVPVLKHIPGHGRAGADSHKELPVVKTALEELQAIDFLPFAMLNDLPMGMTAHVMYTAIDNKNMATTSPRAIAIIRDEIGFDGLLMTDDLSMHAMQGSFKQRTHDALDAGCDVVLHCNGDMMEMLQIAKALPEMSGRGLERAVRAMQLPLTDVVFDAKEAKRELELMLA